MVGYQDEQTKTHRVLITLDEDARPLIEDLADRLRGMGLKAIEVLSLGGVIAGEATTVNLKKIRQVPGIEKIEDEPTFRSF